MSVLGALLGAYAAFAGVMYLGQRRLLFPAPTRGEEPVIDGATVTQIKGKDGRTVYALFVPPPSGAPTVAHFHGNAEELVDVVPLAWAMRRAGLGFFAVEYPGYGLARDHAPSEDALYSDAETALWHLHNGHGVPTERVVLQGQSLGTGVAVEMARRGHGARLVLISPFTSVPDVAQGLVPVLPVRWLVRDVFDTASKAPSIALPVLIVHGSRDEVIPLSMGRGLADLFPSATLMIVDGGHHNDLFVQRGRRVVERIAAFALGEYVAE